MKGCAGADGALNVNLAGVLLDDAVGDRETEPSAAPVAWPGRGLGGEEGIVNAFEMLGCNACAGVGHDCLNMSVDECGHTERSAFRHGLLGVQQEIEKHLLQLAGVAVDGGQLLGEIKGNSNL